MHHVSEGRKIMTIIIEALISSLKVNNIDFMMTKDILAAASEMGMKQKENFKYLIHKMQGPSCRELFKFFENVSCMPKTEYQYYYQLINLNIFVFVSLFKLALIVTYLYE